MFFGHLVPEMWTHLHRSSYHLTSGQILPAACVWLLFAQPDRKEIKFLRSLHLSRFAGRQAGSILNRSEACWHRWTDSRTSTEGVSIMPSPSRRFPGDFPSKASIPAVILLQEPSYRNVLLCQGEILS